MLCIKPHWTWAIPQTICIENISWPSRVSDESWGQVLTLHLHLSFNQNLGTFLKNQKICFGVVLTFIKTLYSRGSTSHGPRKFLEEVCRPEKLGLFVFLQCFISPASCLQIQLAIFFFSPDSFYLLPHLYISAHLLYMLIQRIQLLCNAAQLHAFPCYLANCIAIQMIIPSVSLHRFIIVQPLPIGLAV